MGGAHGTAKSLKMELGHVQPQRFFLHYPEGLRLYVCIVDDQRRPFDFTDNCFKPAKQLSSLRDVCLHAAGAHEERADHQYSYSVEIDLTRLLACSKPECLPTEGANVTVNWLLQVGDEPVLDGDKRLHNSVRLVNQGGHFEPADKHNSDLLDENLAFEHRAQSEKEYREFILQEIDTQDQLRERLVAAVRAGDVATTLRVLADDLCYWAGNLKHHLFHQVTHLAKDPMFLRMRDVPQNAPFQVYETWIVRDWIGSHEAFDLLEFHKSNEYALLFASRVDMLHLERVEFSRRVAQYTVQHSEEDFEGFIGLDELRKDLKHQALSLAEHLDLIASQFTAGKPLNQDSANEREPPTLHTPVSNPGDALLPYALREAHGALSSVLSEAIELHKRTLRFPNPTPVIDAIERFIHELHLVPQWFAELERRALLVESACGPSSPYAAARRSALASYTATPQQLCRGKLAIERLRSDSSNCPRFLSEVIEVRKSAEAVLEEQSLELSRDAIQAFADWRDTCVVVQREAERLEVDGCSYLYDVYRAAGPECADRSRAAKAMLQTDVGGANLDSVHAAANAVLAWMSETWVPRSELGETEGNNRGAKSNRASEPQPESRPFNGGEVVFHPDRVELCGVDICSGKRSLSRRVVLELLGKQQKDGKFVAYSGEDLEAEAKQNGAKGTAGRWIQDLRDDIMEALRNRANIVSGHKDVILSGDRGYRFAESITVQHLDQPGITDITDTEDDADVPDDDVRDVLNVPDDAASPRRAWILQQLAEGKLLKAPVVAAHFKCSKKTALRDLTALKDEGKIEFVGAARTGYYRLCQSPNIVQ